MITFISSLLSAKAVVNENPKHNFPKASRDCEEQTLRHALFVLIVRNGYWYDTNPTQWPKGLDKYGVPYALRLLASVIFDRNGFIVTKDSPVNSSTIKTSRCTTHLHCVLAYRFSCRHQFPYRYGDCTGTNPAQWSKGLDKWYGSHRRPTTLLLLQRIKRFDTFKLKSHNYLVFLNIYDCPAQ
jgi:hypothetical protein